MPADMKNIPFDTFAMEAAAEYTQHAIWNAARIGDFLA